MSETLIFPLNFSQNCKLQSSMIDKSKVVAAHVDCFVLKKTERMEKQRKNEIFSFNNKGLMSRDLLGKKRVLVFDF